MNPAPASTRPFNPPPRLIDTCLSPPGEVPAVLVRGVPATPAYLGAIERLWAPERAQLVTELSAHGESLESGHWDWQNKSQRQPHWHTLVTVECEGAVQGIMAGENLLRPSRVTPSAWVLYLDYIEVAPWNYRVPQNRGMSAVREPRFKGAGVLLLGEAIRMSIGATAAGRVGLHALPQAEEFYTRCGMTRIGPDPHYYDLTYFEYADGLAATCLTAMRLSV